MQQPVHLLPESDAVLRMDQARTLQMYGNPLPWDLTLQQIRHHIIISQGIPSDIPFKDRQILERHYGLVLCQVQILLFRHILHPSPVEFLKCLKSSGPSPLFRVIIMQILYKLLR